MRLLDEYPRTTGHLSCFVAYAIFGFNIIVCKSLTMESGLSPLVIYALRSIGAGALFWLMSLFMPRERVSLPDLLRIFIASVLGFFICQMSFLMAIPDITPMDCSIMGSMTPVYTMFIAAVAVKEPITLRKAGGVALSLCGIIYLIVNSVTNVDPLRVTKPIGIALMVANSLSFALYLGIFRPVIERYSVVTFMKWIFLFAMVMVLPFTGADIVHTDFTAMSVANRWQLAYLIVFATFVAYFLIPVGQKRIRPTLVSMYSYVQPLLAIAISIAIGMDTLSAAKVIAALAVFGGVVMVSLSRQRANQTS